MQQGYLGLKDRIIKSILFSVTQLQLCESDKNEFRNYWISLIFDNLDKFLLHGVKNITGGYWPLVKDFTDKSTVNSIIKRRNVCTSLGRGRLWLALALNDQLFVSYLSCISTNSKSSRRFYGKDAFVFKQKLCNQLSSLLSSECLSLVNLDLDVPYFDIGCINPASSRPEFVGELLFDSESVSTNDDALSLSSTYSRRSIEGSRHSLDDNPPTYTEDDIPFSPDNDTAEAADLHVERSTARSLSSVSLRRHVSVLEPTAQSAIRSSSLSSSALPAGSPRQGRTGGDATVGSLEAGGSWRSRLTRLQSNLSDRSSGLRATLAEKSVVIREAVSEHGSIVRERGTEYLKRASETSNVVASLKSRLKIDEKSGSSEIEDSPAVVAELAMDAEFAIETVGIIPPTSSEVAEPVDEATLNLVVVKHSTEPLGNVDESLDEAETLTISAPTLPKAHSFAEFTVGDDAMCVSSTLRMKEERLLAHLDVSQQSPVVRRITTSVAADQPWMQRGGDALDLGANVVDLRSDADSIRFEIGSFADSTTFDNNFGDNFISRTRSSTRTSVTSSKASTNSSSSEFVANGLLSVSLHAPKHSVQQVFTSRPEPLHDEVSANPSSEGSSEFKALVDGWKDFRGVSLDLPQNSFIQSLVSTSNENQTPFRERSASLIADRRYSSTSADSGSLLVPRRLALNKKRKRHKTPDRKDIEESVAFRPLRSGTITSDRCVESISTSRLSVEETYSERRRRKASSGISRVEEWLCNDVMIGGRRWSVDDVRRLVEPVDGGVECASPPPPHLPDGVHSDPTGDEARLLRNDEARLRLRAAFVPLDTGKVCAEVRLSGEEQLKLVMDVMRPGESFVKLYRVCVQHSTPPEWTHCLITSMSLSLLTIARLRDELLFARSEPVSLADVDYLSTSLDEQVLTIHMTHRRSFCFYIADQLTCRSLAADVQQTVVFRSGRLVDIVSNAPVHALALRKAIALHFNKSPDEAPILAYFLVERSLLTPATLRSVLGSARQPPRIVGVLRYRVDDAPWLVTKRRWRPAKFVFRDGVLSRYQSGVYHSTLQCAAPPATVTRWPINNETCRGIRRVVCNAEEQSSQNARQAPINLSLSLEQSGSDVESFAQRTLTVDASYSEVDAVAIRRSFYRRSSTDVAPPKSEAKPQTHEIDNEPFVFEVLLAGERCLRLSAPSQREMDAWIAIMMRALADEKTLLDARAFATDLPHHCALLVTSSRLIVCSPTDDVTLATVVCSSRSSLLRSRIASALHCSTESRYCLVMTSTSSEPHWLLRFGSSLEAHRFELIVCEPHD